MSPSYKLLIKFPTRGRPDKFFKVLDSYIDKAQNLKQTGFLISLDIDDTSMNNIEVVNKLQSYQKKVKLAYFFGESKTKIQAINADIEKVLNWNILLLASDDMVPVMSGYDEIIRNDMKSNFEDLDGVLWYNDGGQNNINTLSILGKKYYDRFNYIYNPEYISLWCDNEFTEVSLILNKVYKSDKIIIEHQHPVYQKTQYDALYVRNESYYNIDKEIYEKRKLKNFDLSRPITKKISILIPSNFENLDNLNKTFQILQKQIKENNCQDKIEILSMINNELFLENKKNDLKNISHTKNHIFIKEGSDIDPNYIKKILEIYK